MINPVNSASPYSPQLNQAIAQTKKGRGNTHAVMPEGNLSTNSGNGVGATQSFASILAAVTGGSAKV